MSLKMFTRISLHARDTPGLHANIHTLKRLSSKDTSLPQSNRDSARRQEHPEIAFQV